MIRITSFKFVIAAWLALLFGLTTMPVIADVVVVVSGDSPIESIDRNQLSSIFLGRPYRLPNGEYAEAVDLAEGSPSRDEFYDKFIGMTAARIKAHWSRLIFTGRGRPPRQIRDPDSARDFIADHPNVIGYIDDHLVDDRLRVVSVK